MCLPHKGPRKQDASVILKESYLELEFFLQPLLREDINGKKRFLSGIARMMGGGVYPCPNFLALFSTMFSLIF